jgi:hypothetical protein
VPPKGTAMKPLLPLACLLASLLSLGACSDKAPEPQATAATARVATPWDSQKQDLQRAKDVQKTVDDQARKQREAIEAAGE